MSDVRSLVTQLNDADSREIVSIENKLIRIGNPAVEPLIEALETLEGHRSSSAIKVLGRIGNNRAIEPLIIILQNKDRGELVREKAAIALGGFGNMQALEPLLKTLDTLEENNPCLLGAISATLYKFQVPRAIAPLKKLHSRHILYADDDRDLVEGTCELLFMLSGVHCIGAADGVEAVERAIATVPKLIVLDIMMPHMNGFDACRCLKENKVTRNIPIIFLSARGGKRDISYGLRSGVVDYITKPCKTDYLLQRISDVLQGNRLGLYEDDL